MKLSEMKTWLEGDSADARAWRLDPKNLSQVSEMVNEYAATVGGRSASEVWARVTAEKKKAASEKAAIEKAATDQTALEAAVRLEYESNGGKEWNTRSKAILEAFAISGRAANLKAKQAAFKRSQAARTF